MGGIMMFFFLGVIVIKLGSCIKFFFGIVFVIVDEFGNEVEGN